MNIMIVEQTPTFIMLKSSVVLLTDDIQEETDMVLENLLTMLNKDEVLDLNNLISMFTCFNLEYLKNILHTNNGKQIINDILNYLITLREENFFDFRLREKEFFKLVMIVDNNITLEILSNENVLEEVF